MIRIIPRLDIKGPNLVKGIHLEGLRVLGKPEEFARLYYQQGADELLYMDVVASLYRRNSLLDMVRRTAQEVFIPLTVGGGLRSLEDIRAALTAGADKVAINTAAIQRPELVREAARCFGSSAIIVSIEAIRKPDGRYEAYTDNGRQRTGIDALEWAQQVAELGAGEILLTSIDREGTGKGFDTELVRCVASSVTIPVIACGGAGNAEHVGSVVLDGLADAVGLASVLHYDAIRHLRVAAESFSEGNTEFLRNPQYAGFAGASVAEIKTHLAQHGIPCRPPDESGIHA